MELLLKIQILLHPQKNIGLVVYSVGLVHFKDTFKKCPEYHFLQLVKVFCGNNNIAILVESFLQDPWPFSSYLCFSIDLSTKILWKKYSSPVPLKIDVNIFKMAVFWKWPLSPFWKNIKYDNSGSYQASKISDISNSTIFDTTNSMEFVRFGTLSSRPLNPKWPPSPFWKKRKNMITL